jgi:ABC-type transporter Mla maintaining outer membrane lipid asymmetry permease subunit MlaE
MIRINNLQIYSMLMMNTMPLAYLISPMVAAHLVGNNSWLAILTSILPGALLIYMYIYIL